MRTDFIHASLCLSIILVSPLLKIEYFPWIEASIYSSVSLTPTLSPEHISLCVCFFNRVALAPSLVNDYFTTDVITRWLIFISTLLINDSTLTINIITAISQLFLSFLRMALTISPPEEQLTHPHANNPILNAVFDTLAGRLKGQYTLDVPDNVEELSQPQQSILPPEKQNEEIPLPFGRFQTCSPIACFYRHLGKERSLSHCLVLYQIYIGQTADFFTSAEPFTQIQTKISKSFMGSFFTGTAFPLDILHRLLVSESVDTFTPFARFFLNQTGTLSNLSFVHFLSFSFFHSFFILLHSL